MTMTNSIIISNPGNCASLIFCAILKKNTTCEEGFNMDTGLIHIYCGDGKGKTTASLGLTIRCAGRGGKVLFTQFLKDMETGELASLARIPGITVIRGKGFKKFTFQMTPEELAEAKKIQTQMFDKIVDTVRKDTPDMLVLDEILVTCSLGLLDEEKSPAIPAHKARKTGSRHDGPQSVTSPYRHG